METRVPRRFITINGSGPLMDTVGAVAEVLANAIRAASRERAPMPTTSVSPDGYVIEDLGSGISVAGLLAGNAARDSAPAIMAPGYRGLGVSSVAFAKSGMGVGLASSECTLVLDGINQTGHHTSARFEVLPGREGPGTTSVITGCTEQDARSAEEMFLCMTEFMVVRSRMGIQEVSGPEPGTIYLSGRKVIQVGGMDMAYNFDPDQSRAHEVVDSLRRMGESALKDMIIKRFSQ